MTARLFVAWLLVQVEISFLLGNIEGSDCEFQRNGDE